MVAAVSALAIAFIGLVGFAFYKFTAIAFVVLGTLVGIVGFIFLCIYLVEVYQDSEPGLVRLYVKAKKDKVCPLIEFVD